MSNQVTYILSLKDLFTEKIKKATEETDKLDDSVNKVTKSTTSLMGVAGGILAGVGIASFGAEIYETSIKVDQLNNALKFSEGSTEGAAKRFDYLVSVSQKLGLNLESAANGYKIIAAAAKGTVLEGKATQDAFEGVSMAASVMGLTGEQAEGALLAVSQMISKGKVQAEELRGQLGERIPGAFQIAARAMGMTTQELDKFMEEGKLTADVFLPKFAEQLKKEFGDNIPSATDSTVVAANQLSTSYFLLKKEIAEGLKPAIIGVVQALTWMVNITKDAVNWAKEHTAELKAAATFIGVLAAGVALYNGYVFIATQATTLWAAAQMVLNRAMSINPVGAIITAIAALAAGFVYLWETSDKFRHTIMGIWQVIKDFHAPLLSFAKALMYVLSGNPAQAVSEMKKGLTTMMTFSPVESFKKGYMAAEEEDKAKVKASKAASNQGLKPTTLPGLSNVSLSTKKGSSTPSNVTSVKPTQITINIDRQIGELKFYTQNLKESTGLIIEEISKALTAAVNDSQRLANQ